MKNLSLKKYGPILSSRSVGEEIFHFINEELESNGKITIDLEGIKSMATFCAKQIFGKLYLELGSEKFFDTVVIKNADQDLKTIIQIGIESAIRELNQD